MQLSTTLREFFTRSPTPSASLNQSGSEYNPYLAGRQAWDERYGDLVWRVKLSNRIAVICASATLAMSVAFIPLASRPPRGFPIPVDANGRIVGQIPLAQSFEVTDVMKRAALSDWVTNLRMVTSDAVSQRVAIEKVYAMTSSGSAAQTMVTDFYRSAPPPTRAQTETVHASISSLLPTSDKTWEVEWTEVTRDLRGNAVREERWKGVFTFVLRSGPSTDEKLSRLNPIGLFVTHADWTPIV